MIYAGNLCVSELELIAACEKNCDRFQVTQIWVVRKGSEKHEGKNYHLWMSIKRRISYKLMAIFIDVEVWDKRNTLNLKITLKLNYFLMFLVQWSLDNWDIFKNRPTDNLISK